jgi:hypothetical protein
MLLACSGPSRGFKQVRMSDGGYDYEEEEEDRPRGKVPPKPQEGEPIEETRDAGAKIDSGGACSAAGVDVVLRSGQTVEEALAFGADSMAAPFTAPDSCPIQANIYTTERAYRSFLVMNGGSSTLTLSAWAVCDANGDAFLSFYRRSDVPTSPSERRSCAVGTVLSNGTSFTLGDHASPENSGSRFCPSLMKERNVGLQLAPCEKALVVVQLWEDAASTTKTPPSALKMKLD